MTLALRNAVGMDGAPQPVMPWVRRSLVQAPRNGTTSHTINYQPATSGNLLVLVMEGAVTHTVPSGWTRQAQALSATELSVYSKTAVANESSFTTTHNGSNYPIVAIVYEFASTTFVTANSATANSNTGPQITGLTGSNLVFAATAQGRASGSNSTITADYSGMTEDAEVLVPFSVTDGYFFVIAYATSVTDSTYTPTIAIANGDAQREALTFAVKPPVAASSYNPSQFLPFF